MRWQATLRNLPHTGEMREMPVPRTRSRLMSIQLKCASEVDASSASSRLMPVASSTAGNSALRLPRGDTAGRLAVHTIWVLRLRWVACAGQLLTVAYAALAFGVKLPAGELLGVILAVGVSNALLFLSWR